MACPGLCLYLSPATTNLQSQRTVAWRDRAGSSQKLPQKGCCQESQFGVARAVYVLHPRMDSSSLGHACRGTCSSLWVFANTHLMPFPGLNETQYAMGLAGGCGVQEQGRVGERKDITRVLCWLSNPGLQSRRQMEEEVPSPRYGRGLLSTSPRAAPGLLVGMRVPKQAGDRQTCPSV